MIAVLCGLLAGWAVLRGCGEHRRRPWRVVDLQLGRRDAIDERGPPGERAGLDGSGLGSPMVSPPSLRSQESTTSLRWHGSIASARASRGRGARRLRRAIEADLPAVADLLHVAVTAGHSLHGAVAAVGRAGDGPVCLALREVERRFDRGGRLVDELALLPERLGPTVRPLSTTLVVASSSGTPLAPTLQRLADAERRRLRRRTEERVRRLPVLLLGPLVGLVLPAFVLLTVVPVALTTARSGLLPVAASPSPAAETPDTTWSPP